MAKSWELRKDILRPPLFSPSEYQVIKRAERLSGTALDCLALSPSEGRNALTSCRLSLALPSWPRVLLSSPVPKTSLPLPSLPVQPSQPASWQVLLSSLLVSPQPSQPASLPVQPSQPASWPVLPSSLQVLPQPSQPASWPVLLLPWPPRPSAWQQALLSSLQSQPSPPLLLQVLSLPVPWTPALWITA
jgi:hypothetical protein